MSPAIMISVAVAVAVAALVGAVAMFYREYSGERVIDDRLGRLTGQKTPTLEAAGILKEPMFPDDMPSLAERFLPQLPSLTRLFEQADFKQQPSTFWMISGGAGLAGAALCFVLRLPIWMPPVAAIIFATVPLLYVLWLRSARLNKLGVQLCEALELIARALRAGHSLASGMHVVAEEMPDPIATEFGRVYEEQNLGLSIEQAMRNLAERVPNMDLKFFVTAVIIQRTTGGDLAEILDKIGYLIRERFKIKGLIKALTAEGRLSGVILIGLPFFLLLVLMNIAPEYVSLLWTHEMGRWMSAFGILMMILGALMIRKIVDIKV